MLKQNNLLNQWIIKAETEVDFAESSQDLIKIVESFRQLNGINRFNALDYLLYFILTIGTLGTSAYFFWLTREDFLLFLMILSVFALMILGIRFRARNRRLKNLSQKIYQKNLFLKNHLEPLNPHLDFTIDSLKSRFTEFSLGNHTQTIPLLVQGEYQNASTPFTFYGYHFFYSTEKLSKSKDYKNAADMVGKPIYQQSHRYGIIIPFQSPATLIITEQKLPLELRQSQYKNRSLPANFNKHFSIHTSDSQFAEWFLNPLTISLIDSLTKSFNAINIEINGKELLFSCSNKELLIQTTQHSLAQMDAFLLELRNNTEIIKLNEALSTLYKITKYSA